MPKTDSQQTTMGDWNNITEVFVGYRLLLYHRSYISTRTKYYHDNINVYTVNSAYNELLGTMRNSSLYPEFVITV